MEEETKKLVLIARSDEGSETRRLAGLSAVYDLEKEGDFERLWLMQSDARLEREVRVAAGIGAIEILSKNGKTMKLMLMRGCSSLQEVNLEIRAEVERVGIVESRRKGRPPDGSARSTPRPQSQGPAIRP